MVLFSMLWASCAKEERHQELQQVNGVDMRNTAADFISEGLAVDSCCVTVQLRTHLQFSSQEIGVLYVRVYKSGGGDLDTVVTDSLQHWIYEPGSNAEYPYRWTLSYCFEQSGTYCIGGIAPSGGGVGGPSLGIPEDVCFEIKDCSSGNDCIQYVCLEKFSGCEGLDSVTGFSIILIPPDITQISFPAISVSGGYYAIVHAILSELQALNWGGMSYSEMPGIVCDKGMVSLTPGFFFVNSNFRITSIDGVVNCHDGQGWIPGDVKLDDYKMRCNF